MQVTSELSGGHRHIEPEQDRGPSAADKGVQVSHRAGCRWQAFPHTAHAPGSVGEAELVWRLVPDDQVGPREHRRLSPRRPDEPRRTVPDRLPHSDVFFHCADIEQTHRQLSRRGVKFPLPPTNEPFGWWALFEDNEGTRYALEQSPSWLMNTGCSYIPWCRAAAADVYSRTDLSLPG